MGEKQQEQTLETVVDTLTGKPGTVTLKDGTVVEVYKVKMRHIAFMLGFVNRLVAELGVDAGGKVSIDLNNPEQILQLISKLPAEIEEAVVLLTSLTQEAYAECDLAEGLDVVTEIIKVNYAFFTEEVLPKFGSMLAQVKVGNAK